MAVGYRPPPPIDPALLRPHRRWYLLSGAIIVTALATVTIVVIPLAGPLLSGMDLQSRFPTGQTALVRLEAGDHAIYGAERGNGTGAIPRADCTVIGPGRQRLAPLAPDRQYREDGVGASWAWVRTVRVTVPGDHRVRCTAGDSEISAFAIGSAEHPREIFRVAMTAIISVASYLAVTGIGALIGGITWSRRNAHRRRIAHEYQPHPQ